MRVAASPPHAWRSGIRGGLRPPHLPMSPQLSLRLGGPACCRRRCYNGSQSNRSESIMTEQEMACQWCGENDELELADFDVNVANPQVDFDHTIYRCTRCGKLTAEARWGSQHYIYRALEYPRTFRAPIYVLVYDVVCGWCGRGDMIEPEEVNATV